MLKMRPLLSIIIPEISCPDHLQTIEIVDWCLQGCGKQAEIGSKFCSQVCFRQSIQDQDESIFLSPASIPDPKMLQGQVQDQQLHTPPTSPTDRTHFSKSPADQGSAGSAFFSTASFSNAADLYSAVCLCNRNASYQ